MRPFRSLLHGRGRALGTLCAVFYAALLWRSAPAGAQSRGFEINDIQLHQVLAVRPDAEGRASFPLRPDWLS